MTDHKPGDGGPEKKMFWLYRNPDRRCTYPFEPNALGYCWSYANFVDGTFPWANKPMESTCKGCELWKKGNYSERVKERPS